MKLFTVGLTVAALATGTGTVACSSSQQPVEATIKPQMQQQVPVPDAVKVPAGNKLVASFEGHRRADLPMRRQRLNTATARRDPQRRRQARRAALQGPGVGFDDRRQLGGRSTGAEGGRHSRRRGVGAAFERPPKPRRRQFGSVTYVRLASKGGLAPNGACTVGAAKSVKYSATYTFYAAGG